MAFSFVFLPPQTAITRDWAARLGRDVPEVRVTVAESDAEAETAIAEADAVFGTLSPALLARAHRLRWLQAPQAAPPAGFYHRALAEHPLVATNFRGIFNDHIAAHVMAFVLAFARGLHRYIPQQLRAEWAKPPEDEGVVALPGSTMLIVGCGGIGAETARVAAAFGMIVIATDARRADRPEGVAELHRPEALDALLPRADFVVLTVPHTPATEGFFDRARFRRMKPSAFFINIGRGMTTRLDDLVAALRAGEIAGAALDVFDPEPLPAEHPLWHMSGVLLTPHMAGYGPHLNERRYAIIRDNARAFASGGAMRNVVDKANWF
ncbi:MAG TPA: D-2-hydroxyacid dehydrogenase [Acetobacteraceae bacterium]|nr:D-2-hydroxyacid dehydrogenase [Acetobacteraceae bacterium]